MVSHCLAMGCIAFAVSCQPSPAGRSPQSWIQPTIGILQIIVGFVQALILWQLTYRIFKRNAEQRVAERQALWFHKVVVDPQIMKLCEFFQNCADSFEEAARNCISTKELTRSMSGWDEISVIAIGEFNATMLSARRTLVDVVLGFDSLASKELGVLFSNLQESVSSWFEEFRVHQDPTRLDNLLTELNLCHNALLNKLRSVEFEHWGVSQTENVVVRLAKKCAPTIHNMIAFVKDFFRRVRAWRFR